MYVNGKVKKIIWYDFFLLLGIKEIISRAYDVLFKRLINI